MEEEDSGGGEDNFLEARLHRLLYRRITYDTSLSQDVSSVYLLMAGYRGSARFQPRDRDSYIAAFVPENHSGHLGCTSAKGTSNSYSLSRHYGRGFRGCLLGVRTTPLHVVADGESFGH